MRCDFRCIACPEMTSLAEFGTKHNATQLSINDMKVGNVECVEKFPLASFKTGSLIALDLLGLEFPGDVFPIVSQFRAIFSVDLRGALRTLPTPAPALHSFFPAPSRRTAPWVGTATDRPALPPRPKSARFRERRL